MNHEKPISLDWVQCIDLQWIEENYDIFLRVASHEKEASGRGAIAVDVSKPPADGGHPMIYWPQAYIQEYGDEGMCHLVATYDPERELVVMLLKANNRISCYRVRPATP